VHNLKFKKMSIALCMALLPISVFAAGLGKLNVDSGIGEPLRAEIELISVSPEELSTLTAVIASDEAYSAQGIERPASHNSIKVEVAKNASGAPILKLKSNQPISDPFLDMLIQVDWNSGRLLREYTVLLDPPGYTGELDSASQDSQAKQLPLVKSDPMPDAAAVVPTDDSTSASTKKKNRKSSARVKAEPEVEVSTDSAVTTGEEYVTQSGDTLGKIARSMKPEGVSLDRMLVGLFEANKEAFSGNNMNRLKVGQILRPPSEEALNAISRKEASQEIKVQTENWNEYRNKLAGIVADTAPVDSEVGAQSASGKIKSAAEDKSAPATGPKDVVKLSAGDAQAGSAETKSMQAKVAALQEEVVAREKGLKEAQDKTAALEKQVADIQKLLELKSKAMADMQKQATSQTAEASAKPKPVEPTPAETTPSTPASPAESTTSSPVAEKPVEKPAPVVKPAPVAAPAPIEELSFLSGMLDGQDNTLLAGAGGLVVLLGGAWFYLRNKRKKNLADFEQGIMTSGGLKANTVFGNTSGASVDTGDTSFLTDFSQSANGGMIDTNDVDPIAEAEVYMAYGRDAQAEEILKDAISKEPKRYELHLKLLEMYAASKNMSAFETVSGELYTTLGAGDPTWAKVAEIGIKLEPNNPLYQVSETSSAASGSAETEGKLDASDFSNSPLAAEADLDFSLDNDALTQGMEDTLPASDTLDLNIGSEELDVPTENLAETIDLSAAPAEEAPTFEMPMDTPKSDDSSLDFNLGELSMNQTAEDATANLEASPGFAHTMPNLDFPKFESAETVDSAMAEPSIDVQPETIPTFTTTAFQETAAEELESPQVDVPTLADNMESFETVEDVTEAVEEATDQNNFGFDINTISPDMSTTNDAPSEANTLDLSSINLDMDDSANAPVDLSLAADEPAEVETKLELVAAYIEMDDKEGAKELLDEVMREGGATQRKRAEALLTQIS